MAKGYEPSTALENIILVTMHLKKKGNYLLPTKIVGGEVRGEVDQVEADSEFGAGWCRVGWFNADGLSVNFKSIDEEWPCPRVIAVRRFYEIPPQKDD